jgi:predicted DNA-binding transcriptional regulator YafY
VELQLTLSSLVEIERWILSWGGDAKVIEPAELQERVRAAGRKIAAG